MKIVLTINEIPNIIDYESEKMNDMRNFASVLSFLCNQQTSEYDQEMQWHARIQRWDRGPDPSAGFQVGPTFPTFPYFFDLLLLFHENALLSLLFHSNMSFTCKNLEIFPRSLRSLGNYK